MYYCYVCRDVFNEPRVETVKAENYYGVGGEFMSSHTMDISMCPFCGNEDYEEMAKCPICDEYCREDDMLDTEGLPNGGVGYVCPSCYEDILG